MAGGERAQEIYGELQDKLAGLTSSDEWAAALEQAARFHHYSFGNVLLISSQRPDATRVAGFHTWKNLGRSVRKGEKGIAILAPMTFKRTAQNEQGEDVELVGIRGFRVVYVFDVSQTDGAVLAECLPTLLEGEGPAGLYAALRAQAQDLGYTVEREDCSPANGYCDYVARRIVVRPDIDDAQACKTLAHELAHAMMHDGRNVSGEARALAEVEAESVAYVVGAAAGLNSSGYTLPYVATWATRGSENIVSKTADCVIKTARAILDALESATVLADAAA